jgi:ribosomal protein L7Ae-like RNA K-turn-binding protein
MSSNASTPYNNNSNSNNIPSVDQQQWIKILPRHNPSSINNHSSSNSHADKIKSTKNDSVQVRSSKDIEASQSRANNSGTQGNPRKNWPTPQANVTLASFIVQSLQGNKQQGNNVNAAPSITSSQNKYIPAASAALNISGTAGIPSNPIQPRRKAPRPSPYKREILHQANIRFIQQEVLLPLIGKVLNLPSEDVGLVERRKAKKQRLKEKTKIKRKIARAAAFEVKNALNNAATNLGNAAGNSIPGDNLSAPDQDNNDDNNGTSDYGESGNEGNYNSNALAKEKTVDSDSEIFEVAPQPIDYTAEPTFPLDSLPSNPYELSAAELSAYYKSFLHHYHTGPPNQPQLQGILFAHCTQLIKPPINQLTKQLLGELALLQRKSYEKTKNSRSKVKVFKRRVVCGIKECIKLVKSQQIKLIIIPFNVEISGNYENYYSLDFLYAELIMLAERGKIPVIYACKNNQLAAILGLKSGRKDKKLVSCVGVLDYSGCNLVVKQLLSFVSEALEGFLMLHSDPLLLENGQEILQNKANYKQNCCLYVEGHNLAREAQKNLKIHEIEEEKEQKHRERVAEQRRKHHEKQLEQRRSKLERADAEEKAAILSSNSTKNNNSGNTQGKNKRAESKGGGENNDEEIDLMSSVVVGSKGNRSQRRAQLQGSAKPLHQPQQSAKKK